MLILKRNHISIDINLLLSVKTVLLVKSMLSRRDYFKLVIENIFFAKYSAGASLTQSPNDKGTMHSSMHKLFRSQRFNTRGTIELEGATWALVDNYLTQTLEPASYEVVTKCLKQSKIILSRAFNAVCFQHNYMSKEN